MRLTINGEARDFDARDVAGLVTGLGLDPRKVAVERNLEIVPRSLYGRTVLADGDRIEIVHFIGGG
jgi:thiamine biosynthesis protein ThiS